ncbi:hypothetical protein [Streptomyces sp. NPDC059009]|uniref:hypothetical protein n=1 Tax=Streptomyces sp. NPDC059009 TaxID=3346694 RepID=UPI0036BAA7E6
MNRTTGATRAPRLPLPSALSALPALALSVSLALLATGCGTDRPGDAAATATDAAAPAQTAPSTSGATADVPCPGESHSPTARATGTADGAPPPAAEPGDHYAENHGFREPFPLHGKRRCAGLAAVERVERALEPLGERGDFTPESVRAALTGLGYAEGKVQTYEDGPERVGFLIEVDDSPLCVEGAMREAAVEADAFGGYPDHAGCDVPSGGH